MSDSTGGLKPSPSAAAAETTGIAMNFLRLEHVIRGLSKQSPEEVKVLVQSDEMTKDRLQYLLRLAAGEADHAKTNGNSQDHTIERKLGERELRHLMGRYEGEVVGNGIHLRKPMWQPVTPDNQQRILLYSVQRKPDGQTFELHVYGPKYLNAVIGAIQEKLASLDAPKPRPMVALPDARQEATGRPQPEPAVAVRVPAAPPRELVAA